jgi:hypothetical protein
MTAWRFPPHPIRDIHAEYVRQTSEPVMYAVVTVDLEPLDEPAEGLRMEIPGGLTVEGCGEREGIALSFLLALAEGIAEELAALHPRAHAAARIVLRHVRFHPVDSTEAAFRAVGKAAARIAVMRATLPGSRRNERQSPGSPETSS